MKRANTHSDAGAGKVSPAQRRAQVTALRRYMTKWMKDDSGEQEQTWKLLKRSMQENRSGNRPLFRD
jgi:hypothetical protein